MQAISQNDITQGQHGTSKAVDYGASPDPTIYAPEDGVIVSYGQQGAPGTTNDAGLALRVRGTTGLHQFAHTEQSYVKAGDTVSRGQRLAKMGYTGYTIPAGPAGAHCHWWIDTGSANYVYPPSIINESFIKGGDMPANMVDRGGVDTVFKLALDRAPTEAEYARWVGKDWAPMIFWAYTCQEYKDRYAGLVARYEFWKKAQALLGDDVTKENIEAKIEAKYGDGSNCTPDERAFLDSMYKIVNKKG